MKVKQGDPFPTSHYSLSSKQKGLGFPANKTELMVLRLEQNENIYRDCILQSLCSHSHVCVHVCMSMDVRMQGTGVCVCG